MAQHQYSQQLILISYNNCQQQNSLFSLSSLNNLSFQMQHHPIDETEIMQQNLEKLIKNQNYFSCFIENTKEEEPTNPFQKRLFDKNLRRSAISCGHYSSVQHQQNSIIEQDQNKMVSSRRCSLTSKNPNLPNLSDSNFYAQLLTQQPRMQTSHKVSLAQSRHSDPTKQQITQIINNFRLELDYLEEKLHNKVDQLNCRYGDRECNEKDREALFMIESLQKIVGFMVQNCVNLEDSVMYGEKNEDQTGRNSEIMRKQVYQIDEDENEQNLSFSNQNTVDQFKPTHRFTNMNKNIKEKSNVKKRKIVGMIEKENINSGNHQDEENMPQTYYVNSKLHSSNENSAKPLKSNQTTRTVNEQSQKPTKRVPNKSSNQKVTHQNVPQSEVYHYHSSKQTLANHSHSNNTSHNESNQGAKSIYETVLEEREMRMKMKKKVV